MNAQDWIAIGGAVLTFVFFVGARRNLRLMVALRASQAWERRGRVPLAFYKAAQAVVDDWNDRVGLPYDGAWPQMDELERVLASERARIMGGVPPTKE